MLQGSPQHPQNTGFLEKCPTTLSKSYLLKDTNALLMYYIASCFFSGRGAIDNKNGKILFMKLRF